MSEEQAVPAAGVEEAPAGRKLGLCHTLINPNAVFGPQIGFNVDVITNANGVASASRDNPQRDVFIACSPMDINKQIFGRLADGVAKFTAWFGIEPRPNVLFHWAVIVDDYVHELHIDPNYYNIYVNKPAEAVDPNNKLYRGDYRLYKVGTTRLNDAAIVEEGVKAIAKPHMEPVYEVRKNNCHKFVIELLNLICDANRKKVMTTYAFNIDADLNGGKSYTNLMGRESDMDIMLSTVQKLMDQSETDEKIPERLQAAVIDL